MLGDDKMKKYWANGYILIPLILFLLYFLGLRFVDVLLQPSKMYFAFGLGVVLGASLMGSFVIYLIKVGFRVTKE